MKHFLDQRAQDIVDESDENFSVKFELVYTMGTQRPVEYSPSRWVCIHNVLDIFRRLVPEVEKSHPKSVELVKRHEGSFPRTRIISESVREALLYEVAKEATPSHAEIEAVESSIIWAKDNPAPRAKFSHPEIIIILTSLCYYYEGLTDEELFLSLRHLLLSDQADMEYRAWVSDSDKLPLAFHQVSGVNLEDRTQCIEHIFPSFRFSKSAVDYFLAHVVFTKELKEFPHKLSASGWDIGETKAHPTTGFSGTCDARAFLPFTVTQLDLPDQRHTNALVMTYLLQEENSVELMSPSTDVHKSDAETLLETVIKLQPPVRVILDVGAQILELDNVGVAKRWLEMMDDTESTQAVIFCDENDHISVIDRKGRIEPLHTSPFLSRTDVCLVFLDEAHTRGTDLKLPKHYRAAVTLGANLTKDRLVQACMRMRQLGKGQTAVFCVPDETRQKIMKRFDCNELDLTVEHILKWAISDTWIDIQRGIWLWANQGRRHQRHAELWKEALVANSIVVDRTLAEKFLEDEAQSLERRYKPDDPAAFVGNGTAVDGKVDAITERLLQFGGADPKSATFREEQERELSPEIEQEREVQKPPDATPATHSIHPDIQAFISSGLIKRDSEGCMPAFQALAETSASRHFDTKKFPPGLLVTEDFARTIVPFEKGHLSDIYQRSVQWILITKSYNGVIDVAMIISPFEAQKLLPSIQKSGFVSLHLYAPRPNTGFRALDSLDLYTIARQPVMRVLPRQLVTELNLFAGQMYADSFEEYLEIRQFLGFESPVNKEKSENGQTALIVGPTGAGQFDAGLIQFMKVLMMKIRRNSDQVINRMLQKGKLRPKTGSAALGHVKQHPVSRNQRPAPARPEIRNQATDQRQTEGVGLHLRRAEIFFSLAPHEYMARLKMVHFTSCGRGGTPGRRRARPACALHRTLRPGARF
nr:uncharacterized protein CTRU02_07488 [Colletotrichum truncatum]KAF6791148.1 hypothetical protein CTRU02_07488 [Colletotrichum truncatum]